MSDTLNIVKSVVVLCGGSAFSEIFRNTVKEIPKKNTPVKVVGRVALQAGVFALGAEVATIGFDTVATVAKRVIKFGKDVVEAVSKAGEDDEELDLDEFEEGIADAEEAQETEEPTHEEE